MEDYIMIVIGIVMIIASVKDVRILFEPPWWTLFLFYPGFIIRLFINRKTFRILMCIGGVQFIVFGILALKGFFK